MRKSFITEMENEKVMTLSSYLFAMYLLWKKMFFLNTILYM